MIQPETAMPRFSKVALLHTLSRWIAILTLLAGTAGIVIAIGWPALMGIGYMLVAGALGMTVWLPLAGPARFGGTRPVDEFDRMIQTRAWLAAFASACFVAMMGMMFLLALGMMQHWPSMTILFALGTLLTYVMVVLLAVPTLVIGWRASVGDED